MQALRVSIPTTLVAIFASPGAVRGILNALPDVVTGGMAVAGGFIVVVGYAMVLNMMSVKYLMPFFYVGFVLGGYLDLSLLAWGRWAWSSRSSTSSSTRDSPNRSWPRPQLDPYLPARQPASFPTMNSTTEIQVNHHDHTDH